MWNKPGEIIEFYVNSNIKCVVIDVKNVEYERQIYSLSALAAKLAKLKWPVANRPRYFKYNVNGSILFVEDLKISNL